jgi:hypothetical protein
MDGKRPRRRRQLVASTGGNLIFLRDGISGQSFLADSGAAVNVFPHKSSKPSTGPHLVAADGRSIPSWGTRPITLLFGVTKFIVNFVLAAVAKPILGVNFFRENGLLIDPSSLRVLFAKSLEPVDTYPDTKQKTPSHRKSQRRRTPLVAALSTAPAWLRTLLAAFPSVVSSSALQRPQPLHGVKHQIITTGRPVFAAARRLDPAKHAIAEKEFLSLEAAGIVRRSDSAWASPLHMVPKPDGSWRPCGDYRRLNLQTVHDRYPLPNLQDFNARLHGCTVFSKIDLVKGYHQVPMAVEDICKTAIITPFGLFEFLFMPFGLLNAAQSFQRLMDKIFRIFSFVFSYVDDHLIASRNMEEHQQHLRLLFEALSKNGLVVNPEKCVFAVSSLEFLGHSVSAAGLVPLTKHVESVKVFPQPQDIKQLQRFLGVINFYRRFVPRAAAILKPLTDALVGSPKVLVWTPPMVSAFVASKTALAAAVPLAHPDSKAAVSLATDASATHVGAVLQQRQQGVWRPLSFFSKKLSTAEMKYSAFDRELLAVYSVVKHFRFILEGRQFAVFTDHKPITAALHCQTPPLSARV